MTFAAVVAVIFPYLDVKGPRPDATDLEVYKDQLSEIDADEKRGLISTPEAATARIEVSRRILRADAADSALVADTRGRFSKFVLMSAILSIPLVSWGLYANIGAPEKLDQPIASRLNIPATDASMDVLVAKAEEHLAANPSDGRGWEVLAPIYMRLARYQDAIKAFDMASKINGSAAAYEIGIGKAWSGLNGGQADDKARAAYKRASEIDPTNPEPNLLLATDLAQQGKFSQAKAAFEGILATSPADAPWRVMLTDMIARVDQAILAPTTAKAPGPTKIDIDQAAGMSPSDRTNMIEGMVAQLDAKLVENPADKEGWKRLMRSYSVLNNSEKALETLNRAKLGLMGDLKGLSEIESLATELGIDKP